MNKGNHSILVRPSAPNLWTMLAGMQSFCGALILGCLAHGTVQLWYLIGSRTSTKAQAVRGNTVILLALHMELASILPWTCWGLCFRSSIRNKNKGILSLKQNPQVWFRTPEDGECKSMNDNFKIVTDELGLTFNITSLLGELYNCCPRIHQETKELPLKVPVTVTCYENKSRILHSIDYSPNYNDDASKSINYLQNFGAGCSSW